MTIHETVIIVIPVYKKDVEVNEILSLRQCFTVLKRFKICLICPEQLDVSRYVLIAEDCHYNLSIERFNALYFQGIAGYNQLMISQTFYKKFANYEYILIHQTDAYVFKDELEYWCDCGFDYIGAPWFEGFNEASPASKFFGVGNGGLSLRKVRSHLKVLNSFRYIIPPKVLWHTLKKNISIQGFIQFLKDLSIQNNTYSSFNDFSDQEDFFWCIHVPKIFKWFTIPEPEIAAKFSMEVNAPLLYKMNDNHLPFGCHAWEKYHPAFWKSFIE